MNLLGHGHGTFEGRVSGDANIRGLQRLFRYSRRNMTTGLHTGEPMVVMIDKTLPFMMAMPLLVVVRI
jgi:hypothetical protein